MGEGAGRRAGQPPRVHRNPRDPDGSSWLCQGTLGCRKTARQQLQGAEMCRGAGGFRLLQSELGGAFGGTTGAHADQDSALLDHSEGDQEQTTIGTAGVVHTSLSEVRFYD